MGEKLGRVDIAVNFNGRFEGTGSDIIYIGGELKYMRDVDTDYVAFFELPPMFEENGIRYNKGDDLFYLKPGGGGQIWDSLVKINCDKEAREMVKAYEGLTRDVVMYIGHKDHGDVGVAVPSTVHNIEGAASKGKQKAVLCDEDIHLEDIMSSENWAAADEVEEVNVRNDEEVSATNQKEVATDDENIDLEELLSSEDWEGVAEDEVAYVEEVIGAKKKLSFIDYNHIVAGDEEVDEDMEEVDRDPDRSKVYLEGAELHPDLFVRHEVPATTTDVNIEQLANEPTTSDKQSETSKKKKANKNNNSKGLDIPGFIEDLELHPHSDDEDEESRPRAPTTSSDIHIDS